VSDVPDQVRQLLDGSIDAAVVLDRERHVLFYNRAYEALSELRGRQLRLKVDQGARCFEIFPLEICATACLGCKAVEAGKSLRVDEIRAQRGDGEEMTFIVAAVPLEGDLIIETYRDVTADARIQRRLKVLLDRERRAKEVLEEEVHARTKDLMTAQAQLIHQEKMSSLGRLVAGIAHEINNPVNAIVNTIGPLEEAIGTMEAEDVSKRREAADDIREMVRVVQRGAHRTKDIVRALHNYSRTDDESVVEFDLNRGIDDSLELLRHMIKGNVEVVRNYGSVGKLRAHAGQLNQVFVNLIVNAVQALGGRTDATIWIETRERDGRALISLRDNGPGIPPEVLPRIFDPFFTTKDVGEGSGLGLSIVHGIVERHGGTIEVHSKVGQGTTFTVSLPRDGVSATATTRAHG